MYIVELPNGQKIQIYDRTFRAIKNLVEKKITRAEFRRIVRQDRHVVNYHKKAKVPLTTLYNWLVWSYENHKYKKKVVRRKVKWYKVLAVMTFTYSGKNARELEGRLLIDIPKSVYEDRKQRKHFESFCKDAIELFFELAGYSVEFVIDSTKNFGITVLRQFEDTINRTPLYYVEIFDGDYGRYPFRANGTLPPKYWKDWRNAYEEMYYSMERNIEHEWEYRTGVDKYVSE